MGRTKKAAAPAESVQAAQDESRLTIDTPGARTAAEDAADGRIIGPADESELAGCQEDEAVLREGLLTEYAVTAESGLNLRDVPSFAGTILAELPQDAGVYSCDKPEGGWLHVHTGRLEGWMLAEYLEELPLPELSACEPE